MEKYKKIFTAEWIAAGASSVISFITGVLLVSICEKHQEEWALAELLGFPPALYGGEKVVFYIFIISFFLLLISGFVAVIANTFILAKFLHEKSFHGLFARIFAVPVFATIASMLLMGSVFGRIPEGLFEGMM